MALKNQAAWYGMGAVGSAARVGAAGEVLMGFSGAKKEELAEVDIAYAFSLTQTTGVDQAELNLITGQVSITGGAPTIEDEGVDFEGETLPSAAKIYGVLLVAEDTNVSSVLCFCSDSSFPDWTVAPGEKHQWISPSGRTAAGTLQITPATDGDKITVYVLAEQ